MPFNNPLRNTTLLIISCLFIAPIILNNYRAESVKTEGGKSLSPAYKSDLPESLEVYNVIVNFFDHHLHM